MLLKTRWLRKGPRRAFQRCRLRVVVAGVIVRVFVLVHVAEHGHERGQGN